MKNFNSLEISVIKLLLENVNDVRLTPFRSQVDHIISVDRQLTGVGFYTKLFFSDNVTRVIGQNFHIGNVVADIDGLKYGAGFVLFIEDGLLSMLEGYCYDEHWPVYIQKFKLRYI